MVCNSLFWLFFFVVSCFCFVICVFCNLPLSFYLLTLKGSFKTKNRISHALDGLYGFFVCLCFCGVGDAYLSVSYNAFVFFP